MPKGENESRFRLPFRSDGVTATHTPPSLRIPLISRYPQLHRQSARHARNGKQEKGAVPEDINGEKGKRSRRTGHGPNNHAVFAVIETDQQKPAISEKNSLKKSFNVTPGF
jgi:hypothetical protein